MDAYRNVVELAATREEPKALKRHALYVDGMRVEYLEQGSGESVMLLHCSASSSAQWRALVAQLSSRYRVIAPDLCGYGGTATWTERGPSALAHDARIVCALLARNGAPAHLVGHSFGGALALHVARTRPHLVASLTVIEPVAFHVLRGMDDAALAETVAVSSAIERALATGDRSGGIACFVDYWSGPGAWAGIPQEKRPGFAACLAQVALNFDATLNEPASLADFASVALPTLVIAGSASPRPTRRICELLARVLPDGNLVKVDGAGHMAPVTHRDAVNALIGVHLDSNAGRLPRFSEPRAGLFAAPASGAAVAAT